LVEYVDNCLVYNLMPDFGSAERTREYYRRQGEKREQERIIDLFDKYIFGGLVVVPVEQLVKLITEGNTDE
jgi:hypothetical protein